MRKNINNKIKGTIVAAALVLTMVNTLPNIGGDITRLEDEILKGDVQRAVTVRHEVALPTTAKEMSVNVEGDRNTPPPRDRRIKTTTRSSNGRGVDASKPTSTEDLNDMLNNSKAEESIKIGEQKRKEEAERVAKELAEIEEVKRKIEEAKAKEDEIVAQANKMVVTGGPSLVKLGVPAIKTSHKTYMDYRKITNKASTQYKLQRNPNTTTNSEGFRILNGEYMVAVGTYYAKEAGTRIRVTLDTGKQFNAMVGDIKADIHTDPLNQHRNGNVVEFIVDTRRLPERSKKMGDVSHSPQANLQGNVRTIEILSLPQ